MCKSCCHTPSGEIRLQNFGRATNSHGGNYNTELADGIKLGLAFKTVRMERMSCLKDRIFPAWTSG